MADRNGRGANDGSSAPGANPDERAWMRKHAGDLSKTTLRARWVHDPRESDDRKGQTLGTRDPDVIRHWAAEREAQPATATRRGDTLRTLRFDFPGYGGRSLERIDWDAWLKRFHDGDLVFLFQERKRDGSQSNFFRLDSPRREDG
jgi:hypothetical protein